MAKIQPVWALDIGQAALKALKLVPGDRPDEVVAEAFDYIEHPKILSQPDADPESLVREALATFLDRNDVKGCKVAVSVPGQAGLVKFIKLPPVEKKRIPDIVQFEAKQQIPFALNDVVWAYQQVGEDELGGDEDFTMAEVGLFAMKRDQINRAIMPYKVAGIEIDVVQMGPIALYNFITFDRLKWSEEKGSVVLLDIGADHTDLIVTDGSRIWQRNVPIGGNHFTRALTKELKLTFAKAEHLKQNATKAPDPKAVFTAMRGVFNDFSNEVNRSIGFYQSVNRSAKIAKVIGIGNGFKLPGLLKYLQQNLNGLEVEKFESFEHLVGDEVRTAPQFSENVGSFAVTYGLALQGLGRGQLRTNLLPPEIEQARLIRRKKPYVLAASALLMLGFSALFLSDYKALATVSSESFKKATASAKAASAKGKGYADEYAAAKTEWQTKYDEGNALVVNPSDRAKWAGFLKTINSFLPDPVVQRKLDPKNPMQVPIIDKLRVHVDRVTPAWRNDVATEWFDLLDPKFKAYMHPLDRNTPPSGEGWVIQIVGHHYNPIPTDAERKILDRNVRTEYGPVAYLQQVVIPGLMVPRLRAQGVHHIALAWMTTDRTWTADKGAAGNGMNSAAPLLARAAAPAGEGGEGMVPGMMPGEMGGYGMAGMMGGGMVPGMMGGGRMGEMMPGSEMGGYGGMMPGMMGGGMMGGMMGDAAKKSLTTRARTDFMLQFVWQPPTEEAPAKSLEEIRKEITDAESDEKNKGSAKVPSEEELVKASEEKSQKLIQAAEAQLKAAQTKAAVDAAGQAQPGAAPGAPPSGSIGTGAAPVGGATPK